MAANSSRESQNSYFSPPTQSTTTTLHVDKEATTMSALQREKENDDGVRPTWDGTVPRYSDHLKQVNFCMTDLAWHIICYGYICTTKRLKLRSLARLKRHLIQISLCLNKQ